jgi:membrane-associated phospholipid phosphatase
LKMIEFLKEMSMARQIMFVRRALCALLISAALSNIFPAADAASAHSTPIEPRAGGWKTWVLTAAAQMPAPAPPGAKATKEEIDELLSLQAQRTRSALETIRYWDSGSPSYRWNEIAFKVAADSPSSAVTERMLALLNVAVYDAMVAAWDSKYKHKRRRPTEIETRLTPVVSVPESPSFPAEHAVAAGAASAVLSYLFPDKINFLAERAEECGKSRLLAGVQFRSDVTAGLKIGREVAALVIERAKKDGSDAKWTGSVPTTPGLWHGTNPYDPQMAKWKTWVLSSGSQLRPAAPPSFDAAAMAEVKEAAKNPRAKREAYYWAITSLPKYWNELASLKIFEYKLERNPPAAARVYAILSTAYYDSLIACWDAKYAYWGARPFQFDPEFKPLLTTPNFPGYPSGHAMLSATAAAILSHLFPADSEYFNKQAEAAAASRLLGGVHFRVDNEVGLALGRAVAAQAIERARKDGSEQPGTPAGG